MFVYNNYNKHNLTKTNLSSTCILWIRGRQLPQVNGKVTYNIGIFISVSVP